MGNPLFQKEGKGGPRKKNDKATSSRKAARKAARRAVNVGLTFQKRKHHFFTQKGARVPNREGNNIRGFVQQRT